MPFGPKSLKPIECDLGDLKPIPGFDGYFINKQGHVFCIRKLGTYVDRNGYERLSLCSRGKRFRRAIHQLLALVFLDAPGEGQTEVRHLDGNPTNNSVSNLAWGTRAENASDMAMHGTVKGERNGRAKLTAEIAKDIRDTPRSNGYLHRLALKYGVSTSAIKAVREGRNWSHVG
jgi:hypothetical protein